jgi:hypothetical protein
MHCKLGFKFSRERSRPKLHIWLVYRVATTQSSTTEADRILPPSKSFCVLPFFDLRPSNSLRTNERAIVDFHVYVDESSSVLPPLKSLMFLILRRTYIARPPRHFFHHSTYHLTPAEMAAYEQTTNRYRSRCLTTSP